MLPLSHLSLLPAALSPIYSLLEMVTWCSYEFLHQTCREEYSALQTDESVCCVSLSRTLSRPRVGIQSLSLSILK